MDLYMQIGMVFAVMTAFAAFIFVFNSPADMFVGGAAESQQEIENRISDMQSLGIAHLLNKTDATGSELMGLLKDTKASKLAILVQTKNQQGLVVNYGYQMRGVNTTTPIMKPSGYSGMGPAGGTDFEKNFVTSVREIFNATATPSATVSVTYGTTAFMATSGTATTTALQPSAATPPGAVPSGSVAQTPRLMLSDPTVIVSRAKETGRTFSATGFLYTDQVIRTNMPVNSNLSYANTSGSLYRIDQTAGFYSTLILDATGDIIGIYFEEHGTNPSGAVLGSAMLSNGTITQLY